MTTRCTCNGSGHNQNGSGERVSCAAHPFTPEELDKIHRRFGHQPYHGPPDEPNYIYNKNGNLPRRR